MRADVLIRPTPRQVLLGGGIAFLLSGYVFAAGWFNWAGLFRAQPLLSLPATLALFVAPVLLYVSVRRLTESGLHGLLLASCLFCTTALGLIALGLRLWLHNLAG